MNFSQATWHSADHRAFWKGVTVEHLLCVYYALHATPSKVLEVIKEPEAMNTAQSQSQSQSGYLLQFIGNMKAGYTRRNIGTEPERNNEMERNRRRVWPP